MKPLKSDDVGTMEDFAAVALKKSDERLRAASVLYEDASTHGGTYDDVANRTYYAVFSAIQAIHVLDGKFFKRHGQAIGKFNKVYLKNEIFDRSYGDVITDLMLCRHAGDYSLKLKVTKEIAKENLDVAKKIVKDIRAYCFGRSLKIKEVYTKLCEDSGTSIGGEGVSTT